MHSKLVGDSTRRVDQLTRELHDKDELLRASQLGKARLGAEVNQAQAEAENLLHENERLLVEKTQTKEELLSTKMYLASIENVRFVLFLPMFEVLARQKFSVAQ